MNTHFTDPLLISLLTSLWGCYGVEPSRSSFGMHAEVVEHYLHGGYYPQGGASKIAQVRNEEKRDGGGTEEEEGGGEERGGREERGML